MKANTDIMLTHLSLFTGIGGLDLAAEMAGITTVGQCENAAYPTNVLQKHWPHVPKWSNIEELTGASFYERTGMRTVDIISGGIPCQPFSVAGKQKGQGDNRYLWPHMFRVIRELAPRWVIVENVSGIIKIAGDTICKDLEQAGYSVGIFNYEVAAIGAPHRRARVFFVAHSNNTRIGTSRHGIDRERQTKNERRTEQPQLESCGHGEDVAHTEGKQNRRICKRGLQSDIRTSREGLQSRASFTMDRPKQAPQFQQSDRYISDTDNGRGTMWRYWKFPTVASLERSGADNGGRTPEHVTGQRGRPIESRMGRMVNGFSHWLHEPNIPRISTGTKNRVDRLKCLGNAVVPQQAYPIFAAIAEILK